MSTDTVPLRLIRPPDTAQPGVCGVARLADVHPVAATTPPTQGTLAIRLEEASPATPAPPELKVVRGGQPQVRAFATRFAQAVIEVLTAERPPQQLLRCTTSSVYDDLVRRAGTLNQVVGDRRRRLRMTVRSVHVSTPTPVAAEVAVRVAHGRRSRAIAARLDLVDGRWQCTALQFG